MGKNNAILISAKILLGLFFFFFFLYPLLLVLAKALLPGTETIFLFIEVLLKNDFLLWNSFSQALVSTLFAVLVGLPMAYVVARRDFPGKKILKSLSLIPFVFPSILVVISFVIIFGNNGWINLFLKNFFGFEEHVQFLYGFSGIILAHTFYNFPIVMCFVSNAWENTDKTMKEAAKTLGANKLQVFFKITLPQLIPSLIASASLVFIYTFMSFAIVLTLGGLQFSTFEVEIYRQITRNFNFEIGALLAFFQFLILSIVGYGYIYFSKKYSIKNSLNIERPRKLKFNSVKGFFEFLIIFAGVVFIALPIISLVFFAFFDPKLGQFSLKSFEKIIFTSNVSLSGTTPILSIFYSLLLAISSSIIATFFGLLASLKQTKIRFSEVFLSASVAVSVITLGFGYWLGFGTGHFWVIVIGHAIFAFPFAFRIINNALNRIDSESLDAAKTLGANEFQVFQFVQFPRIKNSLLVSLALCFAVSLGELGLVLLLYDGVYATMPVYIYRLLTTFDIFAAAAMGVVLIGISFLSFYTIEYFSKDESVF
ncbi:MAG: iron ABC transporter permease [archaeon]|nr:iron ABC transporter permease [archaeon]